jgi:NAD(P)H-dependent FMN reductase
MVSDVGGMGHVEVLAAAVGVGVGGGVRVERNRRSLASVFHLDSLDHVFHDDYGFHLDYDSCANHGNDRDRT